MVGHAAVDDHARVRYDFHIGPLETAVDKGVESTRTSVPFTDAAKRDKRCTAADSDGLPELRPDAPVNRRKRRLSVLIGRQLTDP
ncbi:hypothetical protein Harman_21660 [Haloarcula mannanilytica]|uniref:Uncharacterized protein n=1 Tax=Haloarcula mannanilytica TaxID=2509225 RepID=A0A4C2EI98_9EURY|nr:hypothetical protein Harman_21660 [Haloarcula mannanilytica]